jgi:predicted P-loop ATPase/GTPase
MAEVVEVANRIFTILNPLEIRLESHSPTMEKMSMIAYQWMPMTEENNIMYIRESHIIAMSDATQYMAEYYAETIDRILSPDRTLRGKEELLEELMDEFVESNNEIIYH